MGAVKEGESFTMKVINNVLKIANTTASDIEVAWYGFDYSPEENRYFELACLLGVISPETWRWYGQTINHDDDANPAFADVPHFTLVNNAVNYVNFPMINGFESQDKIGLYTSDGTAVVPMKSIYGRISNIYSYQPYCGHLLDTSSTGTAEATIDNNNVKIGWVQLWAGGPRFAEKNVDASSATDLGRKKYFAIPDPYFWGANWCTPSKDDMNELLLAASNGNSTKVTCSYTQENSVWGYKFTGIETGYTTNSVFFPADSESSEILYWSGTESDSYNAYIMQLVYEDGQLKSAWKSETKFRLGLVRPVLK